MKVYEQFSLTYKYEHKEVNHKKIYTSTLQAENNLLLAKLDLAKISYQMIANLYPSKF